MSENKERELLLCDGEFRITFDKYQYFLQRRTGLKGDIIKAGNSKGKIKDKDTYGELESYPRLRNICDEITNSKFKIGLVEESVIELSAKFEELVSKEHYARMENMDKWFDRFILK